MKVLIILALVAASLSSIAGPTTRAPAAVHDPRCDAPPYGVEDASAFLESMGPMPSATFLRAACQLKFEHRGDPRDTNLLGPHGVPASAAEMADFVATEGVEWIAHHLQVSVCERPPYGDTVAKFKAFTDKYRATDPASVISILERVCEAKFNQGDRRPLYTAGLTDQDIEEGSTVTVATAWMDTTLRVLGKRR